MADYQKLWTPQSAPAGHCLPKVSILFERPDKSAVVEEYVSLER